MSQTINILLLGGAKRVSFATKLVIAGYRMGLSVELFSYELDKVVPIAQIADIIVGLKWNDDKILEDLNKIVRAKKIDVIIPFVDGAVEVASRYRERYGDVFVPVGSVEAVSAMFDKVEAARRFADAGLPVPKSIDPANPSFPLIAKPRFGSASKGIHVVRNESEWKNLDIDLAGYLLQQYIADREEVTVDCYVAQDNRVIAISPRRRIDVVGGEVVRTVTIADAEIAETTISALRKLNLTGAVTVQFIIDRETGKKMIMEINPRLGGGVVCSVHAGANFPEYILLEAVKQPVEPCQGVRTGIEISRFMQEVVFYNGEVLA